MADGKIIPFSRREIAVYQLSHSISDMTEIAAKAQVDTAKMTHAVPARQETIRTLIVVTGAMGGAALLHVLGVPKEVILAALAVFGVPLTVDKIRKALPKKE